jgi:hypothetical protein
MPKPGASGTVKRAFTGAGALAIRRNAACRLWPCGITSNADASVQIFCNSVMPPHLWVALHDVERARLEVVVDLPAPLDVLA